jgi:hypothetical protein
MNMKKQGWLSRQMEQHRPQKQAEEIPEDTLDMSILINYSH